MELLANRIARSPVPFAVVALALTVLALFQMRHFGRDQLEHDFSKLRRRDTGFRVRATGAPGWTSSSAARSRRP